MNRKARIAAGIEEPIQLPLPGIEEGEDPVDAYRREAFRCYSLFAMKNKQYGNSIDETGVLGAVVELVAKNARLRELVLRNPQWGVGVPPVVGAKARQEDTVEAVRETLRDLVNYGIIGLMQLEKNNWKGYERE